MMLYLLCSILLLLGIRQSDAARDKDLFCGACRGMVDEVEYAVSQIDPKKTIQVGSFRVDTNGNQNTYKKPYARSEVHLTEVLEDVCDQLGQYALSNRKDGTRAVVRMYSRGDETIMISQININTEIQKTLKYACESVLADHEDEIMAAFRKNDSEIEKKVCLEISDYCTGEQLASYSMGAVTVDNMADFKPVDVSQADHKIEIPAEDVPSPRDEEEEEGSDDEEDGEDDSGDEGAGDGEPTADNAADQKRDEL